MIDNLINHIPNITIVCTPPNSGKSYLIKYLLTELFRHKKFKYGIVFCPTKFNGSYDFLPKEYIHSQYKENTLIKFYNLQIKQHKDKGKAPPAFVVFDDCIGSVNFDSDIMKKLASTYRLSNMTLIFATQYIYRIPTTIREWQLFFVTFKQTKVNSFKAIQETFISEKSVKDVKEFINDVTKEKHNFILVNVLEDDENKYTIGKAPEKYKPFKIKY